MSKNLEMAMLLDFYGDLLTEKQKDVLDLYYNQDLSLAEIGIEAGISRQGVRDSIKRGEAVLSETEARLGFLKNYRRAGQLTGTIVDLARDIININRKQNNIGLIESKAAEIVRLAGELKED